MAKVTAIAAAAAAASPLPATVVVADCSDG